VHATLVAPAVSEYCPDRSVSTPIRIRGRSCARAPKTGSAVAAAAECISVRRVIAMVVFLPSVD